LVRSLKELTLQNHLQAQRFGSDELKKQILTPQRMQQKEERNSIADSPTKIFQDVGVTKPPRA
jgi:hypothetical protein